MTKIVKSFDKSVSDFEIEYRTGVSSFINWRDLKPYLHESIGKYGKEEILGIIVDDNGITVRFK